MGTSEGVAVEVKTYTLQEIRMKMNATRAEIAMRLGITVATYQKYERENYLPVKYRWLLCNYANIRPEQLSTERQPHRMYNGQLTKPLPFDLASLRVEFHYTKSTIMQEVGVSRYIYDNAERTNSVPPQYYEDFMLFYHKHGRQRPTVELLRAQIDKLTMHVQSLEKEIHQLKGVLANGQESN